MVKIENSVSKVQSRQPNIFSGGDKFLWVSRDQGDQGKAVFLVDTTKTHDATHSACRCGAPSAFEAVASLKQISSCKCVYKVEAVCFFGTDYLNQLARPPVKVIKRKNAA